MDAAAAAAAGCLGAGSVGNEGIFAINFQALPELRSFHFSAENDKEVLDRGLGSDQAAPKLLTSIYFNKNGEGASGSMGCVVVCASWMGRILFLLVWWPEE